MSDSDKPLADQPTPEKPTPEKPTQGQPAAAGQPRKPAARADAGGHRDGTRGALRLVGPRRAGAAALLQQRPQRGVEPEDAAQDAVGAGEGGKPVPFHAARTATRWAQQRGCGNRLPLKLQAPKLPADEDRRRRAACAARPSRKSALLAHCATRCRRRCKSASPRATSFSDSFMPASASGAPASSAAAQR